MKRELPKIYDPKKVEDEIYRQWEESRCFGPEECLRIGLADPQKPHFSIVLPPPNVTGKLHAGHAAMLAIEDTMVRFARMQGRPTLWIPGTDHAAIATQARVEKNIFEKEGKTRHDLGREKLLEEIIDFAKKSHDTIISQTKKMGSSLDWTREAYTLDEPRNHAVNTAFKKMFDDGLIIKKERVVNWCTHCHSTLSDEEVEYETQSAKIYTFRYDQQFPFEISTTRPETKIGDTAIAVNPKDERYRDYIGKNLEANFCGNKIFLKVIASSDVEMEFGTGALGVTPAHSMIDWQMAQKEDLPLIRVIDEDGKILDGFGEYSGKNAADARKMITERLKSEGLLSKEEDFENNLSICYRCQTPIEPLPSLQWFVDVNKKFSHKWSAEKLSLKDLMKYAVESGKIEIIPKRFTKTYYHWIDNLQDWCISRQIWFGHRIPVWYKNDRIYCGLKAPKEAGWDQDEDTLDTWFSSGLWTFSTMGWPEETEDFKKYHPTTILETGYDILFFWVARMILMTTYLLEEIPFQKVYLHGLVRDEKGTKMSKSLGNIIDPLSEIEKYGTDAFRLSLILGIAPGQDLKLSEDKIKNYRNFTNKLWNISRFILKNHELSDSLEQIKSADLSASDAWIIKNLSETITGVTVDLEHHRLSLAGEKLEKFTWDFLADWYIEASKFEENKEVKDILLGNILGDLLRMWHPFVPFITESIWKESGKEFFIMIEKWPNASKYAGLLTGVENKISAFENVKQLIIETRNARMENKIDLGKKLELHIDISGTDNIEAMEKGIISQEKIIMGLKTGVGKIYVSKDKLFMPESIQRTIGKISVLIPMAGLINIEKEREKAVKELSVMERYVSGLETRLSDENFTSKAPEKIIQQQRESLTRARTEVEAIRRKMKDLSL